MELSIYYPVQFHAFPFTILLTGAGRVLRKTIEIQKLSHFTGPLRPPLPPNTAVLGIYSAQFWNRN